MLSIRFDDKREWWVRATEFDRLFRACLGTGTMPGHLANWGEVANANGGLSVKLCDPRDAQDFESALLRTARQEMDGLGPEGGSVADVIYRNRLAALIASLQPSA